MVIDFRRIEGQSREWVLNHVRAGQDVFTNEIVSNRFKLKEEKKLLKENYYLVFEKVEPLKEPQTLLSEPEEVQKKLKHPGLHSLDPPTVRTRQGSSSAGRPGELSPFDCVNLDAGGEVVDVIPGEKIGKSFVQSGRWWVVY